MALRRTFQGPSTAARVCRRRRSARRCDAWGEIFHDLAGNDKYSEVRNGTGFGLVAGLGVFRDQSGDDVHDFHMPSPPKSATGTDSRFGIGGVIDDEDVCDNKPRFDVGVGNVGAIGVAVDDAGKGALAFPVTEL